MGHLGKLIWGNDYSGGSLDRMVNGLKASVDVSFKISQKMIIH